MNDDQISDAQASDEQLSKERMILRILRKVLASIVRDTTPLPGMLHPLKQSTREDIRDLFGLIAEREAELAQQAGISVTERPYYADQPQKGSVVSLHLPGKKTEGGED
jgi:hypothetical protein